MTMKRTLIVLIALLAVLLMAVPLAYADTQEPIVSLTYRYMTKDGQTVEHSTLYYTENEPLYDAITNVSGGYSFEDELTEEERERFSDYLPPLIRLLNETQLTYYVTLDKTAVLDLNGHTLSLTSSRVRGSGELIIDSAVPGVFSSKVDIYTALTIRGADTVNITGGTIRGAVNVRGGRVNLKGGTFIGGLTVENDGTGTDISLTVSGTAAIKTDSMRVTVNLDENGNIPEGYNNISVYLPGGYYHENPVVFRTGHKDGEDYDQSAYVRLDENMVEQYDEENPQADWGVYNTAYYCWRIHEISYGFAVDGISAVNWNAADILGDGTAVYDPDTATLTLNDADISKIEATMSELNIVGSATITSIWAGNCALSVTGTGSGILCENQYTAIQSNGTLTLGGIVTARSNYTAIYAKNDVDIEEDAQITAEGGMEDSGSCRGIASENGPITIYGGTVNASGGTAGIYAYNSNYAAADITVYDGTVNATGYRNGFYCSGDLDIYGGTIHASTSCDNRLAHAAGLLAKNIYIDQAITRLSVEGVALAAIRADVDLLIDDGLAISSPGKGFVDAERRHVCDPQGAWAFSCVIEPEENAFYIYDLWVDGVQVTSANAADILGDGTAVWDARADTLRLNDAVISTSGTAIRSRLGEMNIVGSATLTGERGILADGGNLLVRGVGAGITVNSTLDGISAVTVQREDYDQTTVPGDLTLGGTVSATVSSSESCGAISAGRGITIRDRAQVTAINNGTANTNYGLYSMGTTSGCIITIGNCHVEARGFENATRAYIQLVIDENVTFALPDDQLSPDGKLNLFPGGLIYQSNVGYVNHIIIEPGALCEHPNAVTAFDAEGHWLWCPDCEAAVEDSYAEHEFPLNEQIVTVRVSIPSQQEQALAELPADTVMGVGNTVQFIGDNKTFTYLPDDSGRISARDDESDSLWIPGGIDCSPDDPRPDCADRFVVMVPGAEMDMMVEYESCGYGFLNVFIAHGEHGKIWADSWFAEAGDTVNFGANAFPGFGYRNLTVKSGDTVIPYTPGEWEGEYSFIMPAGNVTIGLTYYELPALRLPLGTLTIENGAFEGSGACVVYVPEGCTTIGPNAFKDCERLQVIHIPKTVTEIDTTAFDGCNQVVCIYGERGSEADIFTRTHHNTYFLEEE